MLKRLLLLIVVLLVLPSATRAATLYWVGVDAASTAVASNWTTADPAACEPGNGQMPGAEDVLIFDADCDTDASVTVDLTVNKLIMRSGYGGTIQQAPGTTVTVGRFLQDGGVYNQNGGSLVIGGAVVGFVPTVAPTPIPGPLAVVIPENVVDVGVVALATAAIIGAIASLPGLWSTVFLDLLRGVFPFITLFRRRRRPVGRVINELDGLPLSGAAVQIFDVATNRLRETIITGTDGAFGTLLTPGTYLFAVSKPGYGPIFSGSSTLLFPGEQLASEQPIIVTEEGTIVPLVFIMRRVVPYSLAERWRALVVRGWHTGQIILARISLPMLLAGTALTVVALLRQPSGLLAGVSIMYLFFLCLELFVSRHFRRAFGRVTDAGINKPVSLASIRLVDPKTKRIMQTRVTTTGGQYLMLAPRGDFTLQFAHPQYQALEHGVMIRPALGSAVAFDASLTPR